MFSWHQMLLPLQSGIYLFVLLWMNKNKSERNFEEEEEEEEMQCQRRDMIFEFYPGNRIVYKQWNILWNKVLF